MLVADVFKVYLYADPSALAMAGAGEDITSGILNVDIIEGTDLYQGPQQQIDTGQFTIVTRNPSLDPKINPNVKYNSGIRFVDERSGEFFRGYVTDVQVQYQRKDDPIITITGTDIFGAAQRVVVDEDTHNAIMALSTGPTWTGITFSEMIPYMNDFTSKYLDLDAITSGPPPYGFWFDATQSFAEQTIGLLGYSPAKYIPQIGETYLDLMNKYAQTNLTSFSARGEFNYNYINVYSFPKYDPNFWSPQPDPITTYTTYDFSSDPADARPYETVLLDNGYNRVINQVDISNEYRFVDGGELKSASENFTYISSDSIEDYAISKASVPTIYRETTQISPTAYWAPRYAQNIFELTQFPGQEIQKITFDNARLEDIENDFSYSDYNLNQIIRIKHQIDNDETIDRVYNIAGITHNISPDKWEMGFTFKPSKEEFMFQIQGALPTLTMNATSGDTNFNFTATVGSIDPGDVTSITWALSATDPDAIPYIFPYALNGSMFENGVERTGFTQTWNFDDDGILAPYSFDENSPYQDPTDNRYGGYGAGYWNVYAFIKLESGINIVLQQQLTVGTPIVEADFGWAQNLINSFGTVQFTNTSVNNETGEVDSFAWDFGDGTTSALEDPIHTYNPGPGDTEYEVSLTVFAYGEAEEKVYTTHTETVTLVQPVMVPDFTYTIDVQTVTFTNTSTNVGFEEPDAYFWEFDDGTTSTLKNPVHTFAVPEDETESFDVTLTTRNIWEQTESVTKTISVTAFNASGTLPISQVRLTIDPYVAIKTPGTLVEKPLYPYMFDLRARTSFTQSNLIYLAPTTIVGGNLSGFQEADGTSAETGGDAQLNLTRDSSITPTSQYGLTPISYIPGGTGTTNQSFSFTTIMTNPTQFINDILLTFRDVGTTGNITYPLSSVWLNRIHVEVPDSFGGWVRIGYFQLSSGRMDETQAAGQITQAVKTMTPVRPMPMNIPYFKYTIADKTVTFQSMETGTSYAWDFGDGTTSTSQNPVKTYSTTGTKTVSLTVNFSGGGSRTTIEPVIIEAVAPAVRYLKIEQPSVTSATRFGTPTLADFSIWNDGNKLIGNTPPVWGRASNPWINDGSLWYSGTTTTPPLISTSALGASPLTQTQLVSGTGVRVSGDDTLYRSEWSGIADFYGVFDDITSIKIDAAKFLATPSGNPPADGPTYNIYSSSYTGDNHYTARDGSWTLIGTITPASMSSSAFTTYTMTPL